MLKRELEIIGQAILNEVEGYEFYKMAANQDATFASKEAFLELANEELKHVEFLKAMFNKIKDGKHDELSLAHEVNPPSPDIYNWAKVDDKHTSMAMSVFGIGIQMEKDSIVFYENAKESTGIAEAKELYDLLIKWERVHLQQFTEQYEMYKKDWWSEQGFAPF